MITVLYTFHFVQDKGMSARDILWAFGPESGSASERTKSQLMEEGGRVDSYEREATGRIGNGVVHQTFADSV